MGKRTYYVTYSSQRLYGGWICDGEVRKMKGGSGTNLAELETQQLWLLWEKAVTDEGAGHYPESLMRSLLVYILIFYFLLWERAVMKGLENEWDWSVWCEIPPKMILKCYKKSRKRRKKNEGSGQRPQNRNSEPTIFCEGTRELPILFAKPSTRGPLEDNFPCVLPCYAKMDRSKC